VAKGGKRRGGGKNGGEAAIGSKNCQLGKENDRVVGKANRKKIGNARESLNKKLRGGRNADTQGCVQRKKTVQFWKKLIFSVGELSARPRKKERPKRNSEGDNLKCT